MTRLTKTSLFALLGMTVAFVGTTDVLACGRGGGCRTRSGGNYYSRTSYSRPVFSQPVYSQPVQPVVQQPVQPVPVQPQSVQSEPVQPQPLRTAQTSQPLTTAATEATAQKTALEMLSTFGAGETTQPEALTSPAAFTGVGSWTATLTNGATISLEMRADGSFTWTAIKDGKQSTFSGTFTLSGQTLTLNRTDNQQLTGSLLAATTSGFTFKLEGVKDNGVQFVRS